MFAGEATHNYSTILHRFQRENHLPFWQFFSFLGHPKTIDQFYHIPLYTHCLIRQSHKSASNETREEIISCRTRPKNTQLGRQNSKMPPMRIPISRLGQGIRTFASRPASRSVAHRLPSQYHPLHHAPSERILSKAAASHHETSMFPLLVRDATSYGALGALTSGVAFLIYCWVSNISSYPPRQFPFQPVPWIERCDF